MLYILLLAFLQNISITLLGRSRNRNNTTYHIVCAIISNAIFFLTFRELVLHEFTLTLAAPYTVGTIAGSLVGQKIGMFIERKIGALADVSGSGN